MFFFGDDSDLINCFGDHVDYKYKIGTEKSFTHFQDKVFSNKKLSQDLIVHA